MSEHDPLTMSLGLDFAPAIRCCFDMRDMCLEVLRMMDETPGMERGAERRKELELRLETMKDLLERVLEINAESLKEMQRAHVAKKAHDYYYFGSHAHLNKPPNER